MINNEDKEDLKKFIVYSVEIAVKNEDDIELVSPVFTQKYIMYMNPTMYFKWLKTEYKLSNKITLKELPKSDVRAINSFPCYEISFDSDIDKQKKEIRNEKIVMEVGDCQLVAINPTNQIEMLEKERTLISDEFRNGDHVYNYRTCKSRKFGDVEIKYDYKNQKAKEALANYAETKEYLERALLKRGNTHEEVIENVSYNFRLDDDGNVDVVSIVEGVAETSLQRGFRYTCLFCSKIILNKIGYDRHVRKFHLSFLVCKVCDKQLHSLRNFLIHTKTHLGVYSFKCPICGKGLTRASIFKSHMMYHYYGKVHGCQICKKKFRDVFALRRHFQLHDKKIEYMCELCGFGTHLKSNLEHHVKSHASEKLYMCEICGKQFTAFQNLHHHKKTHEPNFPCPHCKRVYRHENKFKNHLEQNHSDS